MKLPELPAFDEQGAFINGHEWSVARLIILSKNLKVLDIPLDHLDLSFDKRYTLREFAAHMQRVLNADLNYPIIMDENGSIMDGRHRIMKALHEGKETIKAVRFNINPEPCRIHD